MAPEEAEDEVDVEVEEKEGTRALAPEESFETRREGKDGSMEEELSGSSPELWCGRRLSPFFDLVLTIPKRPCRCVGGEWTCLNLQRTENRPLTNGTLSIW